MVLSTANKITFLEDPSLWLVIIDHEYLQLIINVRPVVFDDEDEARLTFVVHFVQTMGVILLEHQRP